MPQPNFMLGKNVGFSVTPLTIDNNGVITVVTGEVASLAGVAETAAMDLSRLDEDISSMDATGTNWISWLEDWTLNLSEIKKKRITNGDALERIFLGYSNARIVVTTLQRIYTFDGELQNFRWDMARTKNLDSIVLKRIETAAANPSFSLVA